MEGTIATRDRILEASGTIFARDGFHRAGVRDICACANCNVASVKYYFGDKLGLYRELMRRGADEMRSKRPVEKPTENESPQQTLHRWLREFLELTLVHRHNHPFLGHIMKHELREPTEVLDEMVQAFVKPLHSDLARILRRVTGKSSSETRHTAGLILSMCANLETSRPLFERLNAKLPTTAKELDRFAVDLTRFVLHGVMGATQQ